MREIWDRIGISASLLCVVHCLFTPLLVLFMPIAGEFLSHHMFHVIVAIVVFPIAVWALWNGFSQHRKRSVLYFGAAGIFLMSAGMILGDYDRVYEYLGMIVAGLMLAWAHYSNLRACRISH
jgi:hypothetical protein